MKSRLRQRISKLETIEQKSFWAIGIASFLIGVLSYVFSIFVFSTVWPFIAASIIVFGPLVLMIYCYKYHNYHWAYPLLCIVVGGIALPLILFTNGGLHSGTPILCVIGSAMCVFCYDKKLRYISFGFSVAANSVSFLLLSKFGTMNPLKDAQTIEFDVVTSYYMAVIGLFVALNLAINEVRNYVATEDALSQYLDFGVKNIIKNQAVNNLNNSGTNQKAVIFFADISHFTTTTEQMTPSDTAEYLNVFLSIAEKCVHNNGGVLDKYIGDCAMAYWLDEDGSGSVIMKSINTFFDMRTELYNIAEDIHSRFGTELNFSAGLDYGDVVCGNIGSDIRRDFTVIGDAVNTASRIEGYAAGGELLISGRAAEIVGSSARMELAEESVVFKGKKQAVSIYRVLDLSEGTEISSDALAELPKDPYHFYICGCRGGFPMSGLRYSEFGGETSCYVLKKGSHAVVIDCGSGLQNAESILKDCKSIDILLTHVHYDHIIGLLKPVFPSSAKIRIYGHFSGWVGEKTLQYFMEDPFWPVGLVEMEQYDVMLQSEIMLTEDIGVTFYRADHPNNGCVIKLMAGENKICIFADCEEPNYLDPEIAKNADYLLYDGTFDQNDKTDHTGYGHSTWQAGIEYAMRENVRRLIITHHDPDATDHVLLQKEKKARALLQTAGFARSGDHYIIG